MASNGDPSDSALGQSSGPSPVDGLSVLRNLFYSLTMAGVLIAFVTYFVVDEFAPDAGWVTGLAAALSIMSVVAAQVPMRSRLEAGDDKTLANWYRTKFFLAFAFCEAPYLVTFVLAIFQDAFLPVLIGLPGYVIGMLSIGPTGRNLASLQSRVSATGSPVDVVQALRSAPARPPQP